MRLDLGDFISDYVLKGLHVIDYSKVLSNFSHEDFDFKKRDYFPAGFSPEDRILFFEPRYQEKLLSIKKALSETLFDGIEHQIEFYDSTSYVEYETSLWHTDHPDLTVFDGFHLTFNCYFTDSDEESGGKLEFTTRENLRGQEPIDPDLVHFAYPKKNQIIFLNHLDFMHRVSRTTKDRHFLSFMVKLPLIGPN